MFWSTWYLRYHIGDTRIARLSPLPSQLPQCILILFTLPKNTTTTSEWIISAGIGDSDKPMHSLYESNSVTQPQDELIDDSIQLKPVPADNGFNTTTCWSFPFLENWPTNPELLLNAGVYGAPNRADFMYTDTRNINGLSRLFMSFFFFRGGGGGVFLGSF